MHSGTCTQTIVILSYVFLSMCYYIKSRLLSPAISKYKSSKINSMFFEDAQFAMEMFRISPELTCTCDEVHTCQQCYEEE
jgi:hypothetical protein